ncbi:hypothetical protein D3C73_1399440 [compost metagenome]
MVTAHQHYGQTQLRGCCIRQRNPFGLHCHHYIDLNAIECRCNDFAGLLHYRGKTQQVRHIQIAAGQNTVALFKLSAQVINEG